MSDTFSSPNDGLDLSNFHASLGAKWRMCEENKRARTRVECLKHAKLKEERIHILAEERKELKLRCEEEWTMSNAKES